MPLSTYEKNRHTLFKVKACGCVLALSSELRSNTSLVPVSRGKHRIPDLKEIRENPGGMRGKEFVATFVVRRNAV